MGVVGERDVTHNFERSLAWEAGNKNSPCIGAWLRKFFDTSIAYLPSDLGSQLAGIDAVLNDGTTVDLKLRTQHYGDFLVEIDTGHGKPGWALQELRCDWVLSFCVASCWGVAVPHHDLRCMVESGEMDFWPDRWIVKAENDGWTTLSYALPMNYLRDHCKVIYGQSPCKHWVDAS